MHIPDGYLSPGTCAVFYAAMTPVWFIASRKADRTLRLKELPLLSLGAAFSFVIMMFNVPVPGGSSGHMVGAVVVAVVLGPWAAVIALSLALALQAFFFGDGGITTLAANCFNMAFLMAFSGYYVYRAAAAGEAGAFRRLAASAIAAYIAVNAAALAVAFELGIQPVIAHDIAGRPLYAPYGLGVTVPAMMIAHLAVIGPVEAIGTALVVSYLYKTGADLLNDRAGSGRRPLPMKPLWVILAVMVILTPLGLVYSGTSWGEWGRGGIRDLIGYVPTGMEGLSGVWNGLIPSYGMEDLKDLVGKPAAYIISAAAGSVIAAAAVYLLGRLWRR